MLSLFDSTGKSGGQHKLTTDNRCTRHAKDLPLPPHVYQRRKIDGVINQLEEIIQTYEIWKGERMNVMYFRDNVMQVHGDSVFRKLMLQHEIELTNAAAAMGPASARGTVPQTTQPSTMSPSTDIWTFNQPARRVLCKFMKPLIKRHSRSLSPWWPSNLPQHMQTSPLHKDTREADLKQYFHSMFIFFDALKMLNLLKNSLNKAGHDLFDEHINAYVGSSGIIY